MITTVVFDLDDTLYDEIEYCKSGFRAVASHLAGLHKNQSAEQIFDCLWTQFQAGNRTQTFNATLDELEIQYDNDLIGELLDVYRNHKPNICLPQDSRDVLDILKEKYILALLTDGFLPTQQLKVQALGIKKYFKCIIYTEELGRECWKPSTVGFEKSIQTLKSLPEQTIYVADNEKKDFIAPNKLNFITIKIIRLAGLHKYDTNQPDQKAHYVIQKITELPDLLQRL